MRLLIEKGAEINAVDNNKDSALILAIDEGNRLRKFCRIFMP